LSVRRSATAIRLPEGMELKLFCPVLVTDYGVAQYRLSKVPARNFPRFLQGGLGGMLVRHEPPKCDSSVFGEEELEAKFNKPCQKSTNAAK
jgi:hypothetical protein